MTRPIRKPSIQPVAALGAAFAALALAAPAHAVNIVWGNHGPSRLAQQQPLDYFIDTYAFTLPGGSWTIASTAVANELVVGGQSVYSIIGGTYGLYADPDGRPESGDETAIGAGLSNFGANTGGLTAAATVAGGSYYYLVTGLPIGTAGGAYQLTSAVTAAVPEPGSLGLMLAGVAGVAGVRAAAARRRRLAR